MKILHAIAPGPIAGAEKSALASAKALADDGCEVAFVVLAESRDPRCGQSFVELACESGLPCDLFFAAGRLDIALSVRLQRFVAASGCDIVHSHSYKTLAYLSLHRAALPGFVATYHGATSHTATVRLYEWLEWTLFHDVDRLFAVSQGALDGLQRKGLLRCQVAIVPNALSFEPVERVSRPVTSGPLKLLYLGRLSPEKGVDVLLEALAHVPQPTAVQVTIVGDGPARAGLAAKALSLGLDGRVLFEGFARDIRPYLVDADALVMPSRTEGLPMALIEATASGLPIVASRVGGIPDLVTDGDNGLLVPANDAIALGRAIATLCEQRERYIANAAGRVGEVIRRYGPAQWSRLAVTEYEDVLRSRSLRRYGRK